MQSADRPASAGIRILTNRRYQALIVLTGGFIIYLGAVFILTALGGSIS